MGLRGVGTPPPPRVSLSQLIYSTYLAINKNEWFRPVVPALRAANRVPAPTPTREAGSRLFRGDFLCHACSRCQQRERQSVGGMQCVYRYPAGRPSFQNSGVLLEAQWGLTDRFRLAAGAGADETSAWSGHENTRSRRIRATSCVET